MALDFRQISIDRFEQITQFKLSQYLIRIDIFFSENYKLIDDWYGGRTNKPDVNSFKFLKRLIYESGVISDLVSQNSSRFDKMYFWDLLENLEEIKIQLETTTNLSKLLRSTRTKNSYQSSLDVNYTLKKNETLEKVQYNNIDGEDFDNRWMDIAFRNDLSEEGYDGEGGQDLLLPSTFNSIFIDSVVDNLIGDRLYGRDFNRKITFKDDDLEVLDYKQTVQQSIEILISIRRGSVPEFSNLGLSEDLVVGSNRSSFSLPIIQRQLLNLFNTDDTLMDFEIKTITSDADELFITFIVNTVRGNLQENTIIIKG